MATKKVKAQVTVHDELVGLVKIKPYKAGESFGDYTTRLCRALSPLVDEGDVWNELSEGATDWISAAFKGLNEEDEDAIPELEGSPVDKPAAKTKAKGKAGAKSKVKATAPEPEEDDDDDGATAPDEDDDDDEPPPPKKAKVKADVVKSKTKAKPVVVDEDDEDDEDDLPPTKKAKPVPKSTKAKAAVVEEDEDDEDNEDEQPKKSKLKAKAKATVVEEDDDEDGEGEAEDDDEEPKAKKAKGKADAVRDPSSSKRFRELVVMNHTRNFDRLCRDARKQGIEVADSQLRRIYQSAMEVIKIQVEKGLI